MVMMVFMLLMIVVMMMLMVMIVSAAAFIVMMMMVLMLLMIMVMMMFVLYFLKSLLLKVNAALFHNINKLSGIKLLNRCCYDSCIFIVLTDKCYSLINLGLCCLCKISSCKNDSSGCLNLIFIKFSEIFEIYFAFCNINNCCCTVNLYILALYILCFLNCLYNI